MNKLVSIVIILVAGCRASGDSPGSVDAANGAHDAPVNAVSIKSIRMTQPTNGAAVAFQNVVVVGHVTSKKYGHVWVQDAGGGQYSGVELYCNYGGTTPNCMMTQAQIDALAIGTVVNATGTFNSFLLSTAPAGAQPVVEIESPMITATGMTMPPVAVEATAGAIAKGQLAAAGADPFKGTYVHVTGSFTVSSKTAMEFASTCTDKSTPPKSGTTYGGFEATAGGQTLAVGLSFYNTMTYCLPCSGVPMPYTCNNAIASQVFTGVSGVVEPEYNSNGSVYLQISPTSDADLPHN